MNRSITAALLIAAAVLTNVAFTALGSIFNYPDVLKEPTDDILVAFRADRTPVVAWFTVLTLSAALLRHRVRCRAASSGRGRSASRIVAAVAAAPGPGDRPVPLAAARPRLRRRRHQRRPRGRRVPPFDTAHQVLGHLVGETFGYLFTAAWTLLVLATIGREVAGRWFTALGAVSAVLILAGVLSPLDLPGVDLANFVGYVLWSGWLVAFAVVLVRTPKPALV